jgi:hypothetical protein
MVLAFALVGGSVTQMRIHEASVPPITARLPKHRLVQGPARSYENANEALETLVARLAAVVDRAERRGAPGAVAADGRSVQRRGWSNPLAGLGRRDAPEEYPQLQATAPRAQPQPLEPAVLDAPARQVVSSVLASAAPQAKGRAAKQALRAARPVELDIPQGLAFADGARGAPESALLSDAHNFRPSKMYHIYGGTVNPVARKKLEKRLRRTHTIHSMRRGARALVKQPDARPRSERGDLPEVEELVADDPDRPRSLERAALASSMHYDALEHLENATVAPPPAAKKAKPKGASAPPAPETDELGGLIAHLGEGGEAVVDATAVRDLDFSDGPQFDRRGRQRARIASDGEAAKEAAPGRAAPPAAPPAPPARAAKDEAREKARVDKWLEHTLADVPGKKAPAKPAAAATSKAPALPDPAPDEPRESHDPDESSKRRNAPVRATPARFEVTHGSVEADAEADSDDDEGTPDPGAKRNRTAAQILKEIRQEKKDEAARKEQAEAARKARQAKAAADEIERRIRNREDASAVALPVDEPSEGHEAEDEEHGGEAVVTAATGQAVALQAAPKARRHRSEELEPVLTTAEELSGELEMTLDPVKEEAPTALGAHAVSTQIEMLEPRGSLPPAADDSPPGEEGEPPAADAVGGQVSPANAAAPAPAGGAEPERDVSPEDVVLAGPSTDTPGFNPEEAELSAHDREQIRKRLQEGWNRL